MTKEIIIIALLLLVLYLHYQRQNTNLNSKSSPDYQELDNKYQEVQKVNQVFAAFCKDEIGGQDIAEIRTKLNGKKLSQILEQNEDYELEIDTLTRTKNELEQDLLSQSNSFKSLLKEKEGMITRLNKEKEDLQEWSKKELEKLKEEKPFSEEELKENTQNLERITELETIIEQKDEAYEKLDQKRDAEWNFVFRAREVVKYLRKLAKVKLEKVDEVDKEEIKNFLKELKEKLAVKLTLPSENQEKTESEESEEGSKTKTGQFKR